MSEFKVGLLTLFAIASVIVMSLKLSPDQTGFGEYISYRTIVNDAVGVLPKTPIKVAGINAGRIEKLELLGSQALITFKILKSVKVTRNSIMRIKTVGFLGDKYLDIYTGEDQEAMPRLKAGELIPSQSGGGFEDLTKDASEILSDLKAVMKSLKSAVSPEGKETPLKSIVANIKETVENAKDITSRLKSIVKKNEEKINKIFANVDKISDSLAYHTDTKEKDALINDFKKLGPVLDKANDMMRDLKDIIADVKAGKGTLGKLIVEDEVIDKVKRTLSGVEKIVNKVNSVRTELFIATDVNTQDSSGTQAELDIYPSPERFYRLGIVSNDFGVTEEKEIKTSVNGVETIETREETDKNSFKFNVQIGRKVHDFAFRAGLIESTGGGGLDYYLTNYSSKLSLEIFDFRKDLGPNLKVSAEVHLWNVIYGKVAGGELLSKHGDQYLSVGAGLRFTDEDLKGLIGFLF